jgi:uncharacterized protein (TIGR00255 family)
MTGFGRGEGTTAGGRVVVEVRSVNHRFCEVALRLSARYAALETRLRRLVMEWIARGRVDLTLTIQPDERAFRGPTIDWALAEGLRARLEELKSRLGLPGEVDVALLAAQRGVLAGEEPTPEPTWEPVAEAAERALAALASMRTQEGEAIQADLRHRLDRMGVLVEQIAARAPAVPQEYRERLAARLKALLGDRGEAVRGSEAVPSGAVQFDPGRLEQEVALLADRADVTEELTRLRSHLGQIEAFLTAAEPVGRKLEFLLQEVHREVNTIGSKSADLGIIRAVLELKAELERLREQVANVE